MVLVSSVTRKGRRCVPSFILQNEQKTRAARMTVRGTVKFAVLKCDSKYPDLVDRRVYDIILAHFLSMSAESIK